MRTLSIQFDDSSASQNGKTIFTSGSNSFTIQASIIADQKVVEVDWDTLHSQENMILSPIPESGGISSLGYFEGGIVNIGIFKPKEATTAMGIADSSWKSKWM